MRPDQRSATRRSATPGAGPSSTCSWVHGGNEPEGATTLAVDELPSGRPGPSAVRRPEGFVELLTCPSLPNGGLNTSRRPGATRPASSLESSVPGLSNRSAATVPAVREIVGGSRTPKSARPCSGDQRGAQHCSREEQDRQTSQQGGPSLAR